MPIQSIHIGSLVKFWSLSSIIPAFRKGVGKSEREERRVKERPCLKVKLEKDRDLGNIWDIRYEYIFRCWLSWRLTMNGGSKCRYSLASCSLGKIRKTQGLSFLISDFLNLYNFILFILFILSYFYFTLYYHE